MPCVQNLSRLMHMASPQCQHQLTLTHHTGTSPVAQHHMDHQEKAEEKTRKKVKTFNVSDHLL